MDCLLFEGLVEGAATPSQLLTFWYREREWGLSGRCSARGYVPQCSRSLTVPCSKALGHLWRPDLSKQPWFLSRHITSHSLRRVGVGVRTGPLALGSLSRRLRTLLPTKEGRWAAGYCLQLSDPGGPRRSWAGRAGSPGSWVPPRWLPLICSKGWSLKMAPAAHPGRVGNPGYGGPHPVFL